MNFDFRSALVRELDRMEENYTSSLKTLEMYKGEFPDEDYLKGRNDGSLSTIKMIRKLMEIYKK